MSNNLFKIINYTTKMCFLKDTRYKRLDNYEILVSTFLFGCGSFVHLSYTLGTSAYKYSTIVEKYKMVINGSTYFMIIDNDNKHYNVNNSLWYWKWNSIEDWHKMNKGNKIYFKYYGWRIYFLGIFPNIYSYNLLT